MNDPLNMALMKMTPEYQEKANQLRTMYILLANEVCKLPNSRETSIAKTNLEESLMWAIKSICLESQKANS